MTRPEEQGVETCSACSSAATCAEHAKPRARICPDCGNVTIGASFCRFCAQEPDTELTKAVVGILYGVGELVLRAGGVLRRLVRGGRR